MLICKASFGSKKTGKISIVFEDLLRNSIFFLKQSEVLLIWYQEAYLSGSDGETAEQTNGEHNGQCCSDRGNEGHHVDRNGVLNFFVFTNGGESYISETVLKW